MLWNVTQTLLTGLASTVEIFFLTLLFALPLGLVIAFGSMSKWQPLRFFDGEPGEAGRLHPLAGRHPSRQRHL